MEGKAAEAGLPSETRFEVLVAKRWESLDASMCGRVGEKVWSLPDCSPHAPNPIKLGPAEGEFGSRLLAKESVAGVSCFI